MTSYPLIHSAYSSAYSSDSPPPYSPEWAYSSQRGNRQNGGSSNANKMPDLEDDCTICFDTLKNKSSDDRNTTTVLCRTKCNHFFHEFCLNEWLRKSAHKDCPLCRAEINKDNLTTIPIELKSVVPLRPAGQQLIDPLDKIGSRVENIGNRVASTVYKIWNAISTESPETTKRRQIEVEHRIVELQLKWNKMPVFFNKSKEEIQVGFASVRSLIMANSKDALKAVKNLEQLTKKFEDNLALTQAVFMRDMVNFAKELALIVK